jgi:hypothetical protein
MSITLTFALGNTIAAFIASVKQRETLTSRFAQEKRSLTMFDLFSVLQLTPVYPINDKFETTAPTTMTKVTCSRHKSPHLININAFFTCD